MGPTSMVHAGEAGLTTVVEGMAKVRGALPESIREAADRKLGADSTIGKGVLAMVDTVAEESAKARAVKAAAAAELASAKAVAAEVAEEKAQALAGVAGSAATSSRGNARRILLGGMVIGAVAGGAYFVWRRRQAPVEAQAAGEDQWSTAAAAQATASESVPGVADEQSPDVVDEEFAHQVDEAADEFAAEIVDAIEVPADGGHADVEEAPEPAEPFVPGVADEQSPDVVDEGFAAEVDSVADQIAASVVDAIEAPEGKDK
jgi:hypothetical protein